MDSRRTWCLESKANLTGKKIILPVWYDITKEEVMEYSPILADKVALVFKKDINIIAKKLADEICPHKSTKIKNNSILVDSAWLMDQVLKEIKYKNYEDAMQHLNQVIEINSNYAKAYFLKGLIYNIQKNYQEALYFFDLCLKKDIKFDEAWYEKGILLTNEYYNNYEDAIDCFNKAMEFNPKHEDALNEKRRTIEKKELINNVPHKTTNFIQNLIINILDVRCSKDENGRVHIIFNISEIKHESKDTDYTVNVIDSTGSIHHHFESKIGKKDPNPAKICITFTLPLRKGSYTISFKMKNIVVNKEFETLNC